MILVYKVFRISKFIEKKRLVLWDRRKWGCRVMYIYFFWEVIYVYSLGFYNMIVILCIEFIFLSIVFKWVDVNYVLMEFLK